MITLQNSPDKVVLAGNPVKLKLHTDRLFSSVGSYANAYFHLDDVLNSLDGTIHIEWSSHDITFVVRELDADDGLTIRNGDPDITIADYLIQFAEDLRKNYLLERDFTIYSEYSSRRIYLFAKEKGEAFSLSINIYAITGLTNTRYAGTDHSRRNNYKLLLKVINESPYPGTYGEDLLTPDDDGLAIIDIAEYLLPECNPSFTWPEPSSSIIIHSDFAKAFQLQFADAYDFEVKKLYSPSDVYYALAGGLDSFMRKQNWNIKSLIDEHMIFLTNQPDNKKIRYDQPERLFFMLTKSVSQLKLQFTCNFSEGHVETKLVTFDYPEAYCVHELVITPDTNSLDALVSGYSLESFSVYLRDQDNERISEIRSYEIDRNIYFQEKTFLFRNSLSGYDTLRTTGQNNYSEAFSKQKILVNKEIPETQTWDHNVVHSNTANSGNILLDSREAVDWMIEFFLSQEIYEIIDGIKVPIMITSSKIKKYADGEFLFDVDFTYQQSWEDKHRSRRFAVSNAETFYELISNDGDKEIINEFNNLEIYQ